MDPEPRPSRLRGESVKAKINTILKKKKYSFEQNTTLSTVFQCMNGIEWIWSESKDCRRNTREVEFSLPSKQSCIVNGTIQKFKGINSI